MQPSKPGTSYGPSTPSSSKSRKNSKEREKRRGGSISALQIDNNSHNNAGSSEDKEKSSPSKDSKEFAGLDSEIIKAYAEQTCYKYVSEDAYSTLAEDINYKLRYIIHSSLLTARLQGREAINAADIDETFSNLSLDKVYGAPDIPSWVQFSERKFTLVLEDPKVNLIKIAEEEAVYAQEGDLTLEHTWVSDPRADDSEADEAFRDYFVTMCHSVISSDADLRKTALQDISENAAIAPITEWFYHFAYFLLMKDITYDRLTLRALYLLETLENSPWPSQTVSVNQLKLLVRLLLQRIKHTYHVKVRAVLVAEYFCSLFTLLISVTTKDVLKPMCSVLATLCLRPPLKEMVITKMNQKMFSVCQQMALPLLTSIYFLGIDAVKQVFLPNMNYFLSRISQNEREEMDLIEIIMAIYGLICKAQLNENHIHQAFSYTFSYLPIPYWVPLKAKTVTSEKAEIDFINMKKQLIKTRRKVDRTVNKIRPRPLDDIFEIPAHNCKIRKKLEEFRNNFSLPKRETKITVGKTSLLLSILSTKTNVIKCCGHSLISYNL